MTPKGLRSPTSAVSFYGTFVVVLLVIAALIAVDVYLARIERAESRAEAERYFREGREFASAGDFLQAIERFRTAASVQRDNAQVQLALAEALLGAGRQQDALTAASQLLDADPTNADASLVVARILAMQNRIEEAKSYYHRAIYGRWRNDPVRQRLDSRLELSDLLAAHNDTEELLAELLPLQDEAADDLDLKRRIARLYVMAGSVELASELFREVLAANPRDADAFAGLGEAEFARANYRTARRNFETALNLDPENPETLARLDLTDQVLTLDPLGRGLSSRERYDRSRMLLEMALRSLEACTGSAPDPAVPSLAERAAAQLARRVTATQRNDAVDENLDLAETVWELRAAICGSPSGSSEKAVDLVLTRAAQ